MNQYEQRLDVRASAEEEPRVALTVGTTSRTLSPYSARQLARALETCAEAAEQRKKAEWHLPLEKIRFRAKAVGDQVRLTFGPYFLYVAPDRAVEFSDRLIDAAEEADGRSTPDDTNEGSRP